jgi:hypothetical protein
MDHHKPATNAAWPVIAILVVAGLVFAAVLLTTPPGFVSLSDLVLGPARGIRGAAEAYAVGAAASLSLLTLVVGAGLTVVWKLVAGRLRE